MCINDIDRKNAIKLLQMAIKVALAGSTGKLGPAMLEALLQASFEVVILTRKGSKSTDSLPKHENQIVVAVDYTDTTDLTTALQGVEAVVSTLSSSALDIQKPLIDACVAAGVRRFIPSEFSLDLHNPRNRALPAYPGKIATQEYLGEIAAANTDFTYTYVYNGVWWDWSIHANFTVNAKEHKATLWDGGDVTFSTTRLATVGKAVVSVINNQDATRNRAVYIHDTAITINQLINIIKRIDGHEWTTDIKSTVDEEKSAYEEFAKPKPVASKAFLSFLMTAAFSQDYSPDFTGRLDNELLGIPELQGDEIVEAVKMILTE